MKAFHGVLLKLAPRCDDNASESMQASQERPINMTRVKSLKTIADAYLGKEGKTRTEVGLLYLMSYSDSDGILETLAKFSQKGSKEMKTGGRRTHTVREGFAGHLERRRTYARRTRTRPGGHKRTRTSVEVTVKETGMYR